MTYFVRSKRLLTHGSFVGSIIPLINTQRASIEVREQKDCVEPEDKVLACGGGSCNSLSSLESLELLVLQQCYVMMVTDIIVVVHDTTSMIRWKIQHGTMSKGLSIISEGAVSGIYEHLIIYLNKRQKQSFYSQQQNLRLTRIVCCRTASRFGHEELTRMAGVA